MNIEIIEVCDTEYMITTQANSITAKIDEFKDNAYIYVGNILCDDDSDAEYFKEAIFNRFHSQEAINERELVESQTEFNALDEDF